MDNEEEYGYVYVFGLPNVNGSISYYVEEEIVLVKLQSAAPPAALRTHFQEGYMVGHFPYDHEQNLHKDVARRMLAKFRLRNVDDFWSDEFPKIQKLALFPENDPVEMYFDQLERRDQADE